MPNAKFIKNKKGQKVSVVLDIKEYAAELPKAGRDGWGYESATIG